MWEALLGVRLRSEFHGVNLLPNSKRAIWPFFTFTSRRLLYCYCTSICLHMLVVFGLSIDKPQHHQVHKSDSTRHSQLYANILTTGSTHRIHLAQQISSDKQVKQTQPRTQKLILFTPPKIRIGPNLVVNADSPENQSCTLLITVSPKGRAESIKLLKNNGIPDGALKQIIRAFMEEAIFVPSTVNGIPTQGDLTLEISLTGKD